MTNLRLLALSDIHDDLQAVKRIREKEPNKFDAVVLAGDIGSRNTPGIFDVLSSFECPVLYV
uniref:hypothetical protein n=1 Tax=Morganella morganii TaxID=582 RepID=UPI001954EAA9